METKIAAAETQAPAARMNFFVGVYLVLLFTNVCLFVQVYLDLLFTNAGQSWSKLVHHHRGYWSHKHDETGQDAPNLNKKMRRCWFCWSRFSPMRFCLSQLPRSEPLVVSQRSQMSNQSHPAPDIKHGLSMKIYSMDGTNHVAEEAGGNNDPSPTTIRRWRRSISQVFLWVQLFQLGKSDFRR